MLLRCVYCSPVRKKLQFTCKVFKYNYMSEPVLQWKNELCFVSVCLFPCVIILLLCLQISVCLSHFGWHYPLWSVSWPLSLLCSCFVSVDKLRFLSVWFSLWGVKSTVLAPMLSHPSLCFYDVSVLQEGFFFPLAFCRCVWGSASCLETRTLEDIILWL